MHCNTNKKPNGLNLNWTFATNNQLLYINLVWISRIVMFYDVLSESETYAVKSIATPRFRRATVQNYKTGELETAQYR